MNTAVKTPLARHKRICIAASPMGLGWYTFGLAMTESEKIDEDCAMDNAGVPFYEEDLTDLHKKILSGISTFDTTAIQKNDPIK